jgi:SAM-dependent methyltransferase
MFAWLPKKRWQRWLVYTATWEIGWFLVQLIQRRSVHAAARAAALLAGKPLLVVGNPHGQYPCGDVVLDLQQTGECPNTVQSTVESIPYPDKHFGAAYVSHVLEHVCDPQKALAELRRVAEHVFVVYPYPWRLVSWLVPGHTWLVTGNVQEPVFHQLRSTCNIPNYFGLQSASTDAVAAAVTPTSLVKR